MSRYFVQEVCGKRFSSVNPYSGVLHHHINENTNVCQVRLQLAGHVDEIAFQKPSCILEFDIWKSNHIHITCFILLSIGTQLYTYNIEMWQTVPFVYHINLPLFALCLCLTMYHYNSSSISQHNFENTSDFNNRN